MPANPNIRQFYLAGIQLQLEPGASEREMNVIINHPSANKHQSLHFAKAIIDYVKLQNVKVAAGIREQPNGAAISFADPLFPHAETDESQSRIRPAPPLTLSRLAECLHTIASQCTTPSSLDAFIKNAGALQQAHFSIHGVEIRYKPNLRGKDITLEFASPADPQLSAQLAHAIVLHLATKTFNISSRYLYSSTGNIELTIGNVMSKTHWESPALTPGDAINVLRDLKKHCRSKAALDHFLKHPEKGFAAPKEHITRFTPHHLTKPVTHIVQEYYPHITRAEIERALYERRDECERSCEKFGASQATDAILTIVSGKNLDVKEVGAALHQRLKSIEKFIQTGGVGRSR